jgi:hypothetical protein
LCNLTVENSILPLPSPSAAWELAHLHPECF